LEALETVGLKSYEKLSTLLIDFQYQFLGKSLKSVELKSNRERCPL